MIEQYCFNLTKEGNPYRTINLRLVDFEQRQVLNFLIQAKNSKRSYQKRDIISMLDSLGNHEDFEAPRQRTSMRKLQQILHDLTEMGAPIVRHPKRGVWLASSTEEVKAYADWLDYKAHADIASMMHMRRCLLTSSRLVIPSLFDTLSPQL